MSDSRSVGEAIRYHAGTHDSDPVIIVDAIVTGVDEGNRSCTCDLVGGKIGSTLDNVRLMASIDDGVLIIPALNSSVTIIFSTFTEPIVICFSEVDKIIFRGGDLGGMVITPNLIQKLNNLEKLMNDLISKFNTHTHQVISTGSPSGPNLLPENTTIIQTTRDDIENKNVTQG